MPVPAPALVLTSPMRVVAAADPWPLACAQALMHGTTRWRSAAPRRSLLYKYSPGYSCWQPDAVNAPLRTLATNELQRQVSPATIGNHAFVWLVVPTQTSMTLALSAAAVAAPTGRGVGGRGGGGRPSEGGAAAAGAGALGHGRH